MLAATLCVRLIWSAAVAHFELTWPWLFCKCWTGRCPCSFVLTISIHCDTWCSGRTPDPALPDRRAGGRAAAGGAHGDRAVDAGDSALRAVPGVLHGPDRLAAHRLCVHHLPRRLPPAHLPGAQPVQPRLVIWGGQDFRNLPMSGQQSTFVHARGQRPQNELCVVERGSRYLACLYWTSLMRASLQVGMCGEIYLVLLCSSLLLTAARRCMAGGGVAGPCGSEPGRPGHRHRLRDLRHGCICGSACGRVMMARRLQSTSAMSSCSGAKGRLRSMIDCAS